MDKAYTRVNFEDLPSHQTPVSATTLNIMDKGIDDVDDRVIALDGSKVDKYKDIPNPIDLNTLTETGFYSIPDLCTNRPSSANGGGQATVQVISTHVSSTNAYIVQIFYNQLQVDNIQQVYFRIGYGTIESPTFLSWQIMAVSSDLKDIAQGIGNMWDLGSYANTSLLYSLGFPTHMYPAEQQGSDAYALDVLSGTVYKNTRMGETSYTWVEQTTLSLKLTSINSRIRQDITDRLSNLSQAVAEQNLGKYGYKIGDYFERVDGNRTYTYLLADYNTFKGTSTPYCLTQNHLGIVVDTHQTSQWYSGDASSVGYNGSTLHTYLKGTVMDNIKADMIALFGGSTGLEHLLPHSKLLTTALANWGWQSNQYISALSEVQVFGSRVWGANGYQTGEAAKKLELFDRYKWTEIFGNEYPWLRDMNSASIACHADDHGAAGNGSVTSSYFAVGLINLY